MNKEQLYEDFIKNIINHDYSYDYSDSNTVWERGRQQKDLIRQQLKELINIHKYDPILLLGDCLLARGEQFVDGLTHRIINQLFEPYKPKQNENNTNNHIS